MGMQYDRELHLSLVHAEQVARFVQKVLCYIAKHGKGPLACQTPTQ